MKNSNCNQVLKKVKVQEFFLQIILFLFVGSVYAQNKCPNPDPNSTPKPNMWVARDISNRLEGNFNLQHYQLSSYLKFDETDSIFYPVKSFTSLINYFKRMKDTAAVIVYIASYGTDTYCVPTGYKNKLTLLFAPVYDDGTEKGLFTITPSGNFDPTSDSCNLTGGYWQNHPNKWRDNYKNNENFNVLIKNLDTKETDNYPNHDITQPISDTRAISYVYPNFPQLLDEIKHQLDTNNITVTGIRAFFASFPNTGNGQSSSDKYKNRIIVQFELTQQNSVSGSDEVFYIDDQQDFCRRPAALKLHPSFKFNWIKKKEYLDLGLDNGQLCPPYCQ